jgi:hypothetical protein
VSVGTALLTVKLLGGDVAPPGFTTTTGRIPAVRMSDARICAVNCVELMKVVARSSPLKRTTAPLTKPEPFTVIVKAGLPANALAGVRRLIDELTVRLTAAEVPPLGFMTVMGRVPCDSMSVAMILAVNCVELTNVVGRSMPFKYTIAPVAKFEPFTVRVNGPVLNPAEVGEILLSTGTFPLPAARVRVLK